VTRVTIGRPEPRFWGAIKVGSGTGGIGAAKSVVVKSPGKVVVVGFTGQIRQSA